MAEIGAVATILQIADVGLRLSTTLFTFAETVASADKAVSSISKDVSLTSSVLRELASILQKDIGPRSYSNAAVDSAIEVVREYSGVFQEVESTLIEKLPKLSSRAKDKGSRLTIALERFKWPYLQPKVDLLRSNLDRLKSSLLVILNVISLAKLMKYNFLPKILKRTENEGLLARRVEPPSIDKEQTALVKDLIRSNQEYVRKYEERKHSIANTDPVSSPFLHLHANFQQGVKDILPDADVSLKHETKLEHLHYFVSLFDRLQQEASAPSYVIGLRSRSRILKHIADARSSETMHLHKIHGEAAMKKIWTKISSLPSKAHSACNSTQRVHDNGHVHTVLSEEEEYGAIESPNLHPVYQGRVTNFYWNFPQSPHGKLKPYSEHFRRRTGFSNADRAKFKDANSVDESNTSDEEKRLYYESNPSLSFNPINRWISHLPPASKYSAHFQPEEQPSRLQEQGVAKGNKEKHGVTLADLDCTDLDPALGLGGNDWNTAYDEDATINPAAINSQVCQVPQTPRQEPRPWLVNSDSENEKEDRSIWKASRSPAKRELKRVRTRLQGSVNSGIPYRDKNVCAAEKSIRETTRSVVGRASSQSIRSLRDQGPAMARDSLFMLDTGLDNIDGILIAHPIGTVPQSDWDAPDSWAVKPYNEQLAGTKGTEYFAEASANMNMGRDVPPEYEASKKHSAKSDIRAATEHKYEMSAGYGSSYQCTPPSDVADLAQRHYSSKPTPQGLSIPQQVRVGYRPNQPTQNQLQFQAWKEHESKQYTGSANMSRKSPSVAAHLYQSLEGNGKLQEAVTWSDSEKHTEKHEAEKHVSHEPSEFTHKRSVSPQKSIDHQFNVQKSQRLREEGLDLSARSSSNLDLSARSSSNLDMSLDDMEGLSNNEQRNQVSTGACFADLKAPETFDIE